MGLKCPTVGPKLCTQKPLPWARGRAEPSWASWAGTGGAEPAPTSSSSLERAVREHRASPAAQLRAPQRHLRVPRLLGLRGGRSCQHPVCFQGQAHPCPCGASSLPSGPPQLAGEATAKALQSAPTPHASPRCLPGAARTSVSLVCSTPRMRRESQRSTVSATHPAP